MKRLLPNCFCLLPQYELVTTNDTTSAACSNLLGIFLTWRTLTHLLKKTTGSWHQSEVLDDLNLVEVGLKWSHSSLSEEILREEGAEEEEWSCSASAVACCIDEHNICLTIITRIFDVFPSILSSVSFPEIMFWLSPVYKYTVLKKRSSILDD